jgi:DNA-directed RNA polymerase specialized sigma24 family protein
VADDREAHLTILPGRLLQTMMDAMAIPPFERLYEQHAGELLGYLTRLLGRQAAEDAWQETFLRALRAYPTLRHGRHLRAWLFTIATRIALDEQRRAKPVAGEPPELPVGDGPAAFAELAPYTAELPPTERAAVVLRYGYDLDYAQIGSALGSSAEAARAAASSGVRRLRRTHADPDPR